MSCRRRSPGSRLLFSATAYCKGSTTASGVEVRSGIAAADPDLLPVGSVVQVDAPGTRYDGVYTVMDTGPRVQGRHLDLYMWSCNEALRFGRTADPPRRAAPGLEPGAQLAGPGRHAVQAPRGCDARSRSAFVAARADRPRRGAAALRPNCAVLGLRVWRSTAVARVAGIRCRAAQSPLAPLGTLALLARFGLLALLPRSFRFELRLHQLQLLALVRVHLRVRQVQLLERVDDGAGHDQPREPLVVGRDDVPRRVRRRGVRIASS